MKKELYLHTKGYRVTNNGHVINPNGVFINGWNDRGYSRISFRYKGDMKSCAVHRLQALQKYGEDIYKDGIIVRHLNGNQSDNSWNNIAIGTNSQNQMDIPPHIRLARSLHAAKFNRKYDRTEVKSYYYNNGNSYKKTMEHFGMSSKGTLHFILNK